MIERAGALPRMSPSTESAPTRVAWVQSRYEFDFHPSPIAQATRVIMRAIGPSLSALGITGALSSLSSRGRHKRSRSNNTNVSFRIAPTVPRKAVTILGCQANAEVPDKLALFFFRRRKTSGLNLPGLDFSRVLADKLNETLRATRQIKQSLLSRLQSPLNGKNVSANKRMSLISGFYGLFPALPPSIQIEITVEPD